jgi:signal transduction histidine kinase
VDHRIETLFPGNGFEIVADPDQIKQVFWNLAQNALKAMPEGGRLVIAVEKEDSSGVMVSFSDNGIGMTEDEVKQIFQPFYSQFSRGVGLGMSIVYQIVQSHNAKIHVQSRKGMGTTVTLGFPG